MTVETRSVTPPLELPQEVSETDKRLASLSKAIRRVVESDPTKTEYEANASALVSHQKATKRLKELAALCLVDVSKLAVFKVDLHAEQAVPTLIKVSFLNNPGVELEEDSVSGVSFYVRGLEVDPEVEDGLPYYEHVDLFDERGKEIDRIYGTDTDRSRTIRNVLLDSTYCNFQLGLLEEIVAPLTAQNVAQSPESPVTQ